ncbi:MAG: hypothetical protein B7Z02_02650 [Rhodobacterales bacterium 32-67-9]|nr:MAG: hypothetical protein B7Z02_02650 [Rhodobacterales bacterium 32-67-9]
MRILSARIARAHRDRRKGRVEAEVALTVLWGAGPVRIFVATSAPCRAPGAAPLRDRLLGAAKLSLAFDPARHVQRRAA